MQKIKQLSRKKKILIFGSSALAAVVLITGAVYGALFFSTPEHLRQPSFQHYHFRTQILVNGKAVDFSQDKYQKETGTSAACSAAVGSVPIDFHDKMDQLTHVHWTGMTGGEFLKDYGWNLIGGNNELLGRRYDNGIIPSSINIYGKLLPAVSNQDNYYVYTGDKSSYQQKDWNNFLKQDLETFFGKKSNVGHSEDIPSTSFLDRVSPKAYAHGDVMDAHSSSNKSEEELTRINNLIGNVVIFAQDTQPTKQQIEARFNKLVPLHDSSCGE